MSGSGALDRRSLVEDARRIEALGYDVFFVADHLLKQLAPLPALVSVAEATARLRVGTFVLNNDLRHPAVVAQEITTIDQLTGGRLELGLGAGWNQPEYDRAGIPFDRPGVRVGRMEEAIRVLKGLMGDGPFNFEGAHYQIREMECWPKPVQRPHPPLIIGGGGRRVMRLAGREAQILSLAPMIGPEGRPPVRDCLAEGVEEKIRWAREAADGRAANLEIVTYTPLLPVTITDDPRPVLRGVVDLIREAYGVQVTEDELLDSPHIFVGTVDALVEKCLALRERFGISAVNVLGRFEEFAPVVGRLSGA